MSSEERSYWLFFSAFEEGIGPVRFQLLLKYFKTAQNAWAAANKELTAAGIPQATAEKFVNFRNTFDQERYLKILKEKEIHFLILSDEAYPYLLKQISDPPFVLYVKGDFHQEWFKIDQKIAVVGTRKITAYGKAVTQKITSELVDQNLTIVSGLAWGVDTVAHQTALTQKGKTIAVLGCGVDLIYPPQNRELYQLIVENGGCVVSEMPLSRWVSRAVFPARNRIISGLSRGVLVTEGAIDSGSLITCSYAAEQGREVFAVPGQIDSLLSQGPLSLLKKGAKLVTSAQDILEECNITYSIKNKPGKAKNRDDLNKDQKLIISFIDRENLTADDIIKKSGLSSSLVLSVLSMLEIKGYIEDYGGKYKIAIGQ